MLRKVGLILAAYSLLMPPGVCFCGAFSANGAKTQLATDACTGHSSSVCADGTEHACPGVVKPKGPCSGKCPISCPGHQKTSYLKLVGRYVPTTFLSAANDRVSYLRYETSSFQCMRTAATLLPPSARPIYLTLCTLVI